MRARSILRDLRVKLKNGFLREPPIAFEVLRKTPAHWNAYMPRWLYIKQNEMPYLKVHRAMKERNAMYPRQDLAKAYENTFGMIISKRMYQLMKQGLSEEAAYVEATKFITERENEAFQDLKKLVENLEQNDPSVLKFDEHIQEEYDFWNAQVKIKTYGNLQEWERGPVDKFLQFYVLKWTDNEAKYRLRDLRFTTYYMRLFDALFPLESKQEKKANWLAGMKEQVANHPGFTARGFYIEDYIWYYNQFLHSPNFEREWTQIDQFRLKKWVEKTLILKPLSKDSMLSMDLGSLYTEEEDEETEGEDDEKALLEEFEIEQHLKKEGESAEAAEIEVSSDEKIAFDTTIRAFFPMYNLPKLVPILPKLDVMEVKRALYENEIGYKKAGKDRSKTLVRRFYLLPKLLFPRAFFLAYVTKDAALLE
jgi:hypothetical protein